MKKRVLAYSPVDVPHPEYEEAKFLQFFEENRGVHRDHGAEKKSKLDRVLELWDVVTVRKSRMAEEEGEPSSWYKYQPNDLSWYWAYGFEKEFPGIVSSLESLPFKRLTYVALFRNRKPIPLHQDRLHVKDPSGNMVGHLTMDQNSEHFKNVRQFYYENIVKLDPSSYRFILYGEGHKNFLVSPTLNKQDQRPCSLPKETSCFLFNTDGVYHGAGLNESGKILMYVSGVLDPEKHLALIEKSLRKYSEQAIFFDYEEIQRDFDRVPLQDQ